MPELAELVDQVGEWMLYPVYKLPPRGQWSSQGGRAILLGDSAHAVSTTIICISFQANCPCKMPPQGESTGIIPTAIMFSLTWASANPCSSCVGICIEDAILFSRALMHHRQKDLPTIFAAYEKIRRPNIDQAYNQAVQRWETVKDSGYLVHKMMTFLTPWFLWWTAKAREEEFSVDYADYDF
jgi:salicylate hydroxylase